MVLGVALFSKLGNSQGVFHLPEKKKKRKGGEREKNDDCTRQSVSGPGGTDATQTKICSIFQGYGNESQM